MSLACGGLAASAVREHVERVEADVGRPVPVLVARRELPAGRRLRAEDLGVRQVPARFIPPDALGSVGEAIGAELPAPLAAGGYLTAALLAAEGGRRTGLRRGERVLEVAVAGGAALAEAAPGARVDVLVSADRGAGGRTDLALEDVELLALRSSAGQGAGGEAREGAAAAATATATLRVTVRQALYLTAAQNFARELRLLLRPPGDRGRLGPRSASSSGT
jgi:pilus assembly protein CpaB